MLHFIFHFYSFFIFYFVDFIFQFFIFIIYKTAKNQAKLCIKYSFSQVPGQYKIRGAKEREEKLLQSLPTSIAHDLRQPEHRIRQGTLANSTYISRMESLQAAVDTHLSKLVHSEPNKRVSIVTFSDDVCLIY